MNKFFIEVDDDITVDQISKALKKFTPIVMHVKSMMIENDGIGNFIVRRQPPPEESAIRRIIRDEIGRMGR